MVPKKRFPPGQTLTVAAPKPARVFEGIIEYFRDQMANGQLRPGDKLLPERELSERLGVSRHSLREALRALEMLGVIEVRVGQGAYVRVPDFEAVASFLGVALSLQPTAFDSVMEARIAIECEAIRLAATRADASDLRMIKEALDRIPDEVGDPLKGGETDFAFHTAIVRASHSPVLLFAYEALAALLQKSHQERRSAIYAQPDFVATIGEAHRQLYDAIVARDPEGASARMRSHFFLADQYYSEFEEGSE